MGWGPCEGFTGGWGDLLLHGRAQVGGGRESIHRPGLDHLGGCASVCWALPAAACLFLLRYGQLSGMVEPLAGVFGAFAVVLAEPLLPYALAFAAGAMVYVVMDDIIPEAQVRYRARRGPAVCIGLSSACLHDHLPLAPALEDADCRFCILSLPLWVSWGLGVSLSDTHKFDYPAMGGCQVAAGGTGPCFVSFWLL